MDSFHDSVTAWIGDLKEGQDAASQKIWERYFERLVRVASRQLGSAPRRIADEEDVALSVFRYALQGRRSRALRPTAGSRRPLEAANRHRGHEICRSNSATNGKETRR